MCQPKDKGGKRCAAHMSGSLATVSMASIMSGIKEDFVRKVFSTLNREGKNLPDPSEEEIIAFARNNQFISRHDITIPDEMRATLIRRWKKAESEKPSGAAFHAWKHTLVESVVRWRRTATVMGIGSVLAFTSACSGGTIGENSPAPTSSPTSISQSADPSVPSTPSPSSDTPAGEVPEGFGTPAPPGKKVESPNGSYTQSTISDDDPAMKLNPAVVDSSLAGKDPAEIESAQKFIVKFTAEEGIDSRLNGDSNDVEAWWAEHESKINPIYKNEIHQAVQERKAFVMNEQWQVAYNGKYDYITHPEKTRIYDRQITPKILWAPDSDTVAVQMDVSYKIPVTPGVGQTGSGVQITSGTMTYAVSRSPQTGEWLLNGFDHDISTTEG